MPFFCGKCTSTVRLVGKTAVVTGCNTGIGRETVLDLYTRGARVIMACRNVRKAEEAKTSIERECENLVSTGNIVVMKCDLSSLKSVRECAAKLLDAEPQINILINNAGIMMCPKGETEDGFETQFGTNHLGHFLFTLLLLPRIRNSTPARIVTVSSSMHTKGKLDFEDLNYKNRAYGPMNAYSQSKLANVSFSQELASKLKEYKIDGIHTYSLHPGAVKTEIARHIDDVAFKGARAVMDFMAAPFYKSPKSGAQTNIYCAVDKKCEAETGLYYSDCVVRKPSKRARNDKDAKRLWDLSNKLVGLEDYNPFTAVDPGVKNSNGGQ